MAQKNTMMSLDFRKSLISNKDKDFTVDYQRQLPSITKSTYYYLHIGINDEDLTIMSIIDRLYLEDPTTGIQRYAAEVKKRGYHLGGRQHARTFMQLMEIAALYPMPRTTVIDKAKYRYPFYYGVIY